MARNDGQILRQLMEPAANQVGADFNIETIWMNRGGWPRDDLFPETVAFGLLHCGGQLLAAKTYRDEFPARKARVARRGAKLLLRVLGEPQTITASIVLARAQARLMAERLSSRDEDESARTHGRSAEFLLGYFPLDAENIDRQDRDLDEAFANARRLRGQDLPDHAAPEPIAAVAFQQRATLHALELALGAEFMETNFDALVLPGGGLDAFTTGHADSVGRWNPIDERRMLYVRAGYERDYF